MSISSPYGSDMLLHKQARLILSYWRRSTMSSSPICISYVVDMEGLHCHLYQPTNYNR
jgi:hypothetical protein